MAPRGELHIKVWFGPSRSPAYPSAVSYARAHAGTLEDLGSGAYLATFTLHLVDLPYAELEQLVEMVKGWKTTRIEVDGYPEHPTMISWMAGCARHWLKESGRCAAWFPNTQGANRCRSCPLYDAAHAKEFWVPGRIFSFEQDPGPDVPDHVPEEWL